MHAVVRAFIYLAKQSLEQLQCRSALVLGEFGFLLKDLSENRNEFVELRQRLDPGLIFENWSRSTNHLRNRFLGKSKSRKSAEATCRSDEEFQPDPRNIIRKQPPRAKAERSGAIDRRRQKKGGSKAP
jgi:hypothetical protein